MLLLLQTSSAIEKLPLNRRRFEMGKDQACATSLLKKERLSAVKHLTVILFLFFFFFSSPSHLLNLVKYSRRAF
jgi:hypothetical protein